MIRLGLGSFALLAVLHVLGWREHVGFLSGTQPATPFGIIAGLMYSGNWFFSVLIAPVLVMSELVEHFRRAVGKH